MGREAPDSLEESGDEMDLNGDTSAKSRDSEVCVCDCLGIVLACIVHIEY